MKKEHFTWFTLVELIIVITILSILSSIAFVSFQGYSKNARDSNRLETMNTIEKWISINQTTIGKTLLPDDNTQVLASWSLLWYEWIVWESVSRWIQMNSIPKDPVRWENYIYYTNKDRDKVQVMWFLEGEDLAFMWIDKVNASWSWTKIPKVIWDRLWILLDSNNNRISWTNIDILLTNSWIIYTTYFTNSDKIISSWSELYSNVYNRRSDLLNDKSLANLDDSLVGYWDMETTTMSWSEVLLKDLSRNWNNLNCYSKDWIISDCKAPWFLDFVTDWNRKWIKLSHISWSYTYNLWNNRLEKDWTWIIDYSNWFTMVMIYKNPLNWTQSDTPFNATPYWYHINSNNDMFFRSSVFSWSSNNCGNTWVTYCIDSVQSLKNSVYNRNQYNLHVSKFKDNKVFYILNWNTIYEENNVNYTNFSWNQVIFIWWAWLDLNYWFNWTIDEVRFYNRALSDQEIKEIYNTYIK
jgi:prepilin-type N-terminal cleavage/methylation domain-containing protein